MSRLQRRPFRGWYDWRLGLAYWICLLLSALLIAYGVWHEVATRT